MHTKHFIYIIIAASSLASCKSRKVYEPSPEMSLVHCEQVKAEKIAIEEVQLQHIAPALRSRVAPSGLKLNEIQYAGTKTKEPLLKEPIVLVRPIKSVTAGTKKAAIKNLEPAEIVKWVFVGLLTALLFVLFVVFLAQASISPGLVVVIGAIVAIGVGAFMIMYFNN